MTLGISEWVAIILGSLQIITTIALSIWQVKASPAQKVPEDHRLPSSKKSPPTESIFRRYWPSWLTIMLGAAGLIVLFTLSTSVTKSFVALAILLSSFCIVHIIMIGVFQFAFFFSDKIVYIVFYLN
jgi:hypothetical protein